MGDRMGAEALPTSVVGRAVLEPAVADGPASWRFDGFEFDLRRGELRGRDGMPIALRPKAELLLRQFLAQPGRLLSREELMAAVWPAAVVTDDSLVQCVGELRTALGDSDQHLIRTVPRRGYRFEATVVPGSRTPVDRTAPGRKPAPDADGAANGDNPTPIEPRAARSGGRRRAAWLGAGLAVAAAAAVLHARESSMPVHIDEEIAATSTAAVMPFAVPGAEPLLRRFADNVADEIAAQFASRIGMRGIGRVATSVYGGASAPLATLGSALKATHVVMGRVESRGEASHVQASVQLVTVASGEVIWARQFDVDKAGGADAASYIGQHVVNALRNRGVSNKDVPAPPRTATELTLAAWADLDRARDMDDVRRARGRFEAALQKDPRSVIATNGLTATYARERSDPTVVVTPALLAAFKRAVERSRALAPQDATALLQWATMQVYDGRPELALPALEKATRLVPSYPYGHQLLGQVLLLMGRAEEVRPLTDRAIDLGYGNPRAVSAAYALAAEAAVMLGDDEMAHDLAGRGVAALPTNATAFATLAAIDALAGRDDAARAEMAEFRKLRPAATVANYDDLRRSIHPRYLKQRERFYQGLRKAGLPAG